MSRRRRDREHDGVEDQASEEGGQLLGEVEQTADDPEQTAKEVPIETEGRSEPSTLPVGLKEMDPAETRLMDNWERRVEEDGTEQWICRGDFKVLGGVVPQGTIRSLPEAFALEVQRLG